MLTLPPSLHSFACCLGYRASKWVLLGGETNERLFNKWPLLMVFVFFLFSLPPLLRSLSLSLSLNTCFQAVASESKRKGRGEKPRVTQKKNWQLADCIRRLGTHSHFLSYHWHFLAFFLPNRESRSVYLCVCWTNIHNIIYFVHYNFC